MRSQQHGFRVRAADDPASLLVLVLDVSANAWQALSEQGGTSKKTEAVATLRAVTEQLLVFINTFSLMHEGNRVSVILASPEGARLVYPSFHDPTALPPAHDSTTEEAILDAHAGGRGSLMYEKLAVLELRDVVAKGIQEALQAQECERTAVPVPMSAALATAQCFHNRARLIKTERAALNAGQSGEVLTVESRPSNGRILVVTPGRDTPKQYVAVMNCIFSAQRMGVSVDSCVLSRDKDSTYFQQVAHLTNGVYLRPAEFTPKNPNTLIQFLQTLFLVDRQSRDFLAMPTPEQVDFRTSCMQKRKIITDGYTCSVFLSTFDSSIAKGAATCPVCNARFAVMPRAVQGLAKP